ncbi:hypothetical protein V8J88_11805 [Massilia sp. W12]|uniref:hypothetical protein n=1 Tax=Massilia sp. W12 TaxID=3126507 RepID=UPI0030CB384C
MHKKTAVFAALALLPAAFSAHAALVTWEASGRISDVTGYTEFQSGDTFNVRWSFDSDAAVLSTNNNRYTLDPSALRISYRIGANFSGQLNYQSNRGGFFYLRDNQIAPGKGPDAPLIDGLTFGLNDARFPTGMALIMRWHDTNVIQNQRIPLLPPALTDMEANSFQGGDGADYNFVGQFNHIAAVPEAQTWAMLGAGLFALGALARRRRA